MNGLEKRYGDRVALAGVDLEVHPGEVVALVGPNGAGKTTLVSIVCGLRHADAGSVTVGQVDALRSPAAARRLLGLAPQELALYPTISARHNLRVFGELADLRGVDLQRAIDEVAEGLDLVELLDRSVRFLSGGEQRRVHTAVALLHRPPLVLLDEPTAGVDVATRAHLLAFVKTLAERGTAVCYSTHYLREVEDLGATVVMLDHGRIIASGAVDDLIATHAQASIQLTIDESVDVPTIPGAERFDSTLRVPCEHPADDVPGILAALGPAAKEVRSIELLTPDLESVFLQLTGRTAPGRPTTDEDLHVTPS